MDGLAKVCQIRKALPWFQANSVLIPALPSSNVSKSHQSPVASAASIPTLNALERYCQTKINDSGPLAKQVAQLSRKILVQLGTKAQSSFPQPL